ncbi:MAG: O-antigen ligase family protein, partial [Gammaproteobacteria bacterium]|nr:O-antigen ligase family protein [Gammaproteobacteria bacterium]
MNYRIFALIFILLTAMITVGKDPTLLGILPFLLILWASIEIIACYRKRIVVEPIIFGFILANCTWWLLSVFWSESPSATLVSYYIPASILTGYLLVTLWQACSEKFFAHTDTVVIAFAVISALYAIYQVVVSKFPASLMANVNNHAALLNLISFMIYFKLLDRGATSRNKIFYYLAFMIISTAMFSSGSRGIMLSFVTSLGLMLVVLHREITRKERLFLLSLPLLSFIFSVVLTEIYNVTYDSMLRNSMSRAVTLTNIIESGGLSVRYNIWKDSLNLIDFPNFFGHGLGTFWLLFAQTRDSLITPRVWYAHNDLLQIWIEVGLVGLLLFMGLFLYISFRSICLLAGRKLIYRDRISLTTIVA